VLLSFESPVSLFYPSDVTGRSRHLRAAETNQAEFVCLFRASGAPRGYRATLCPTTRLRGVSAPTVAILTAKGTETFEVSDVSESIVGLHKQERRPRLARGGVLRKVGLVSYLAILYVLSPAAFFED